ncbi:MAG: ComF family protein [Candidatus Alcyoniella australis]|nr:ComF family protein [Candidatus Alcyoniella australis]
MVNQLPQQIVGLGRALLQTILPPVCHGCRTLLAEEDVLCATCRADLEPVQGVLCQRCGKPFVSAQGSEHTCSSCLEHRVQFDVARAAFVYSGVMTEMIQAVKFEQRYATVRALVELIQRPTGALNLADYDVATCVPMTTERLRRRMANPGAMIASRLAQRWGMPYEPRLLSRVKQGPPQSTLKAVKRWSNVRGAFVADRPMVRGRAVLLIDDLITTGATADACSRALRKANASAVGVFAIARTVEH